jgi:hypothetical protein
MVVECYNNFYSSCGRKRPASDHSFFFIAKPRLTASAVGRKVNDFKYVPCNTVYYSSSSCAKQLLERKYSNVKGAEGYDDDDGILDFSKKNDP